MKHRKMGLALVLALLLTLVVVPAFPAYADTLNITDIKVGDTVDNRVVTAINNCSSFAYCTECKEIRFVESGGLEKVSMQEEDAHSAHANAVGYLFGGSWDWFCGNAPAGEYTVTKNERYHEHVSNLTPVYGDAAACKTSGTRTYWSCSCGKYFSDINAENEIPNIDAWLAEGGAGYIAPKGHVPVRWQDEKPSTCENFGLKAHYECQNCWDFLDADLNTIKDLYLPLADHDFSSDSHDDEYLKTPASCTRAAEYYYSCSACGEKDTTRTFFYGAALGHALTVTMSDDEKTATVTCAHEGCTVCSTLTVTGATAAYTGEPVTGSFTADDDFTTLLGLSKLELAYADDNGLLPGAPTEVGTYYVGVPITYKGEGFSPMDVIEITEPVAITKQPESRTVTGEKKVYFTVEAEGEGLTYQWQQKKPGKTAWANCVSATAVTDTLAINARTLIDGYTYRCVVSDGKSTAISETATLTVEDIPVTTQPESQTVTGEKRVYFTVSATGEGLTYQWQQRKPGQTAWCRCVSATAVTDTLAINAREAVNGYAYRCVITGSNGSVISEIATLTVKDIPITTQPKSQNVTGEKKVYFTVKATGNGLTYQWQQKKPGQTAWCRCVSATATTAKLAINAREAVNGYTYRCVITGANGSVISETATLTVKKK